MARSLSAELTAEQVAVSATPYIKFKLISADLGTTHDYSARVLQLEHHEVAYNDYATVVLRNDDRGVASDLIGYWVQIGYGFYTGQNVAEPNGDGAGNEYSYTPRLWVKAQGELSVEGRLVVILELEGMWAVLRELILRLGTPPDYFYPFNADGDTTGTIYNIIEDIIENHALTNMTLDALGGVDDGIIDTLSPTFDVNGAPIYSAFDDCASVIRRLLEMTKCYLRLEAGLEFKLVYPQSGDSINQTYYSNAAHFFHEYLERKKALVPNHIYVMWGQQDDGSWDVEAATIGEAIDATEIAKLYDTPIVVTAGELTTEGAADDRASALLTRVKAEILGGHLVIPHDCGVELYDRVSIEDNRGT